MTGRRNLSTPHAELAVGLTEGKCSPAPAESRTRMGGVCELSVSHARRKSAYQQSNALLCCAKSQRQWIIMGLRPIPDTRIARQRSLPVPHPIDRKAGLAIFARAAKNHFVREHMLSHHPPAASILEWGKCKLSAPHAENQAILFQLPVEIHASCPPCLEMVCSCRWRTASINLGRFF